ncbi:MAG TPA: hypothetical protein VIH99_13730 [Bdellovibrionota bacterium]|jgi:hypothetical protein
MHLRKQNGQAMMIAILCLGTIMAGVVMFGSRRQENMSKEIGRNDTTQAAYEALASVARRVQFMYSNESACDPETLDNRLSEIQDLPTNVTGLFSGMEYAVAQPNVASTTARKNLCSSGSNKGCRQIAVPLDGKVYVVTVGAVSRDDKPGGRVADCPRDASVRLSTTVNKNVYVQNITLTNLCTLKSCTGTGFDSNSLSTGWTLTGTMQTASCTGSNSTVVARNYGGGFTSSSSTTSMKMDDLRWARRYLETGGGDSGEVTYALGGDVSGNATVRACTVANSVSQCKFRDCYPALDLNRDGMNNDTDLAILENFMRGYLSALPVNALSP